MNSKIPYPDERYARLARSTQQLLRAPVRGWVSFDLRHPDRLRRRLGPYQASRAPVAPVPESILFVSILHISFGHSGCLVVVVLCSHLLA